MVAFFCGQVDLVLQASIFVFGNVGLVIEHKRKIKVHAWLMLVAVALNLASFFAIMAPVWDKVGEGGAGGLSTVGMVHVDSGRFNYAFELLGAGHLACADASYATGKLRCCGKLNKRIMTAVTVLWFAALIAGFLLYLMVNTTLLGSFPIASGGN